MELSIVTTLYKSAQYIEEFYSRITNSAERIVSSHEIVFIDDGSPDNSLEIALRLHELDKRVRVIELSRNFGHHKAIMTGLTYAKGDLVFLMDVDLEEEPEVLKDFYELITNTPEIDVVYALLEQRKGGLVEKLGGSLFYGIFNHFSSHHIDKRIGMARLMKRNYVNALISHRDKEAFLAGLWAITGFHQLPAMIRKSSRGISSYSTKKRIALMVNALTSFSSLPLAYIFYLGAALLFLSTIGGIYQICRWLFYGDILQGWLSIVLSIWFMGGISIFCIGLVGIYLAKIFMEVKDRPYTTVRRVYER